MNTNSTLRGDEAKQLSEQLIHKFYTTLPYAWTRHHIESYDQFLSSDIPAIVKAANPIVTLQEQIGNSTQYAYKAEFYIGGYEGDKLYIGTPTVNLKNTEDIRILYPNEARLRNLTYSSLVQADITIRITFTQQKASGEGGGFSTRIVEMKPEDHPFLAKYPLFRIPIMLHSKYCILHNKPEEFLKEAGECVFDYGGYFIVDGSEKVLITRQEQAFNTLYVQNQEREPQIATYATISCLNQQTRQVRRVAFGLLRRQRTLQVSIPYVRKPVPIFVLFRALGIQSDKDIVRLIFPDPDSAETKLMEPMLQESIVEAHPFLDTYSAVQYIKVLTKGFSEAHVLDILHNQLFVHVDDRPMSRAFFLAECVRKILRVAVGLDTKTDRDDTRNQRCLTSGFLTRMLFQGVYTQWVKYTALQIDKEFKFNKTIYSGDNFLNLFSAGSLFNYGDRKERRTPDQFITAGINRGFKGKWGSGVGEEKSGVLQALSRLSYMDFLSHCRRVVLDFDTGMKLQGPRRLHTSQFGYFCTNETPGGASIGITKNLSNFATISISVNPTPFINWLLTRGGVIACENVTPILMTRAVPVFVNAGIIGYTLNPLLLRDVTKLMKWSGCLPPYTSIGFNIRERRIFFYLDEGRPVRPLIHLGEGGQIPVAALQSIPTWKQLVMGNYPDIQNFSLSSTEFYDPLRSQPSATLENYKELLKKYTGVIEYVDPYEGNECYVACFPEDIQKDTTHLEIHPSTIFGLMTSVIPFANHNQSPRNQLSCSQSKQGLSVYATNYKNRFDNQVHVLSYPETPIVRTRYYDYVANGQMGYGNNLILAMGCFSGYNQDDGIVMNADSVQRGMFHSTAYRSYETFEEDDPKSKAKTRVANPSKTPHWLNLKPGLDYSKLDERGIIREGEYVDESTVLVGRYIEGPGGETRDASLTPQVWTSGRVEKTTVLVGNNGLALVKVRIVQYRIPELGDKFSNRHGQKGTIGMLIRAHDMPRSASGIVPDMMMNTHAIPSRMTMAQLLEALLGKCAALGGTIGNATTFMNDGSPAEAIGKVLQEQFGMEKLGEELLYDGTTGTMIPSTIFMGNVYTMRLKHMVEDKWNARAEGRREQRTHQPTGGRGNQGGLRMGEMERDAVIGHGIASFVHESYMKRADGTEFVVCNGCGTIPIYNEKQNIYVCPMCDGPVRYIGENAMNLELLPPSKRSLTSFSKVEIPYALKLLEQELSTYMNIGMRILTTKNLQKLESPDIRVLSEEEQKAALSAELPQRVLLDTTVPEFVEEKEEELDEANGEDLTDLAALPQVEPEEQKEEEEEQTLGEQVQEGVQQVLTTTIPQLVTTVPQVLSQVLQPQPQVLQPQAQVVQPQAQVVQPQPQVFQIQQQVQENQQPAPTVVQQQQQMFTPVATAVPVQQGGQIMMMTAPPPAQVLAPLMPGAPPMISIDTSSNALQAQGLSPVEQQETRPIRSALRRAQGGGGSSSPPPSPSGNVRVNVIKN